MTESNTQILVGQLHLMGMYHFFILHVFVYRWMLTVACLLASILIIFLSACAKLILSLCLLLYPVLMQVLSALIVAFLSCQKVRRSRKRKRERKRERATGVKIFSFPLSLTRNRTSTHFGLISVEMEDRRGERDRLRERKGSEKGEKDRGTGVPSYILMTQTATLSIPVP